MYTAAVLNSISSDLLRWIMKGTLDLEKDGFVLETDQGQQLPHHMTINLGAFDESLNCQSILGQGAILKINKLVFDDTLGVCATPVIEAIGFRFADPPVVPILTINEHPHITICIKPGVRPVESNKLLAKKRATTIEVELDQTYELQAVVQQIQ